MRRITYVREYDVTMLETYVVDVPEDLLTAADEAEFGGGPEADALDQWIRDNADADKEESLGMLEDSLVATWTRHPVEQDDDLPDIEVKCYCPECKLATIVPVPYRKYVAWMDHTPLEELIDDEDTVEVLTTGRCEMHRATKGEQG